MAGEKSGSLEQVIRRYVQHIKVMLAVRSTVISALIYPAVLLGLSVAVVGMIVFKVMPEFGTFYAQYGDGAQLPMSTRIVVGVSRQPDQLCRRDPAGRRGGLVAGGGCGSRQPGQKKRLHASMLRLPFFGPLARKLATAQVVEDAGHTARAAAFRWSTRSTLPRSP